MRENIFFGFCMLMTLLACNDKILLFETKKFLLMKDLKDASLYSEFRYTTIVLGKVLLFKEIWDERSKIYLFCIKNLDIPTLLSGYTLDIYRKGTWEIRHAKHQEIPLWQKETFFSPKQCPKNDLEAKEMQKNSYALAIGSLMFG